MTYKIKAATKKPVLEPEKIIHQTQSLLDRVATHRRWIGLGVGLAVLIGLLWGGTVWVKVKQDREARLLEYQASKALSAPVSPGGDPAANQQKAAGLYQEIIEKYPKSASAPFAQYQLGNIYSDLKEFDKAIAAYQDFIERYSKREDLLPMVYLRLGYAQFERGDSQAALANFEQVIKHPKAWNKDQAYYETGRVYEWMGNKEAAISKYEGLIKEFPKSPWTQEAQLRLKTLGVFEQAVPQAPTGEDTLKSKGVPEKSEKE